MFTRKSITELFASAIIFLFLYTGISKYLAFKNFIRVLGETPLLGKFAPLIAYTMPAIEILISVLLIIPRTRLKGFYLATTLMSIFTVYLIYMVIFTPNRPCSCGGVLSSMTWTQHIFFNLAFLIIAAVGTHLQRKLERSNGSIIHRPMAS